MGVREQGDLRLDSDLRFRASNGRHVGHAGVPGAARSLSKTPQRVHIEASNIPAAGRSAVPAR